MQSIMKILLKILAVLLILVLALMFILPLVFEDRIEELAREEINTNVNARVDFKDIDLSLFRNFPNFTMGINDLSVIGKGVFEGDTLAVAQNISVSVDLFSVFRGDNYELSKIAINTPKINVRILDNGLSNYDISLPEETEQENVAEEASSFSLRLKSVSISNGSLIYIDEESRIEVFADGLQSKLSGDLTADATAMRISTTIEKLTVNSDGMNYLTNSKLRYKANIEADMKNEIYTLGKNELLLNELLLNFNGSVSFIPEGMNLALTFDAPQNKFKSLLSLVPAVYSKDFEGIEANGNFSLNGNVKGVYNEEELPSFSINLRVDKGYFKYAELPKSVDNISIETNISNPGGTADATLVDISSFNMTLGGNPMSARLKIKTPVSDPEIDGKFNGEIDLSAVKDFYPLEKSDILSGVFAFDLTLMGKLSFIENEQYDKFIAMGSMLVREVDYSSSSFEKPISIANAQLNFSPQYLDLVSFQMKTGNNDLKATGKVENYLAYVFADGTLKGKLNTESKYFNLDELLSETEKNEEQQSTDQGEPEENLPGQAWQVPAKIDFTLSSRFDKLIYDKLEMKQVKGKIIVKDEMVRVRNLQSTIVGGQMTVNGTYLTKNLKQPKVEFGIKLKNVDIPASYDNFALVRKYMPVAKKTKGKLSAGFTFSTSLDDAMMPVYESLNGKGQLNTSELTIDGMNTFEQIAQALSVDALKKLTLDKMKVSFRFINGKMITSPFTLKYKNISGEVEGWTSLDQSIGYVMSLNIPRSELGSEANKLLDGLVKEANKLGVGYELPETIKVGVKIGGTLTHPKIKTDLKQSSDDLVKKAKEEILKEVSKELKEQAQQILAEADKAAKRIMSEAKKQADALNKNADIAVAKLNKETDKQAADLMKEAHKQGALAEFAAREVVKKLRAESDKQVQSLRSEADKKADAILGEAKKQSVKLKKEARKQADALLKQ
jgi:vacuolar-type H+-ATPase subunit H